MRPTVALLLVIGVLLGPVYYAWCLLFSGHSAQTIQMAERAARWVTADGSILRFTNGLAYKPVALELTPGMNRVKLRIDFKFADDVDPQAPSGLRYQASLAQLDHTILEHPFMIKVSGSGSQSEVIGPMDIPYPAEYLFVLEELDTPRVIPSLSLELITNVEIPAKTVIWSGMALLVIALIVALRDTLHAARKQPRSG